MNSRKSLNEFYNHLRAAVGEPVQRLPARSGGGLAWPAAAKVRWAYRHPVAGMVPEFDLDIRHAVAEPQAASGGRVYSVIVGGRDIYLPFTTADSWLGRCPPGCTRDAWELGLIPVSGFRLPTGPALELTALACELPRLAPWLAAFLRIRDGGDCANLPAPPMPLSFEPTDAPILRVDHIWTSEASQFMKLVRAMEGSAQ